MWDLRYVPDSGREGALILEIIISVMRIQKIDIISQNQVQKLTYSELNEHNIKTKDNSLKSIFNAPYTITT